MVNKSCLAISARRNQGYIPPVPNRTDKPFRLFGSITKQLRTSISDNDERILISHARIISNLRHFIYYKLRKFRAEFFAISPDRRLNPMPEMRFAHCRLDHYVTHPCGLQGTRPLSMGDENRSRTAFYDLAHLAFTFLPETAVSNGQHLIKNQNFRLNHRSDCKCQP